MNDVETYLTEVRKLAEEWAIAKGNLVRLQEFKHPLFARLYQKHEYSDDQIGTRTVKATEQYAYADPDYEEWVKGVSAATEVEAKLRWRLRVAEWYVDLWRTKQANERMERKAYGA